MHGIFLSSCIPQRKYSAIRPLGPYQVAWYLRQHGYEIQVIDFVWALEHNQILDLVDKFVTPETKFIGMGFMIDFRHTHLHLYGVKFKNLMFELKKRYPQIKIIVGGGTSFEWSVRYKNKTLWDYVVKGYGEDSTLALFNHYFKGKPHPPFELIDGNVHLSEHLVPQENKLFNIEQSRHTWHPRDCIQKGEALPIEFARGCIFKCRFCRYPHIGKKFNDFERNIECIKEELIDNYTKYGVYKYYVTDDTFNADHERIQAFTEMVKTLPFKIQYGAFLRADLLHAHPDTEDMYLENGLATVFFGIESFNAENAKLLGKAWSGKHAKTYVPELYHNKWNKNIHITMGLICGLPYESYQDLQEINKWCIEQDMSSWAWHPLTINRNQNYYKSEFDTNAEKYGFKFKMEDGKMIWHSHNCDSNKAIDWCISLQNEVSDYNSLTTWGVTELGTYGYNLYDVGKIKGKNLDWEDIGKRYNKFLTNYFNDLKKL